MTEDPTRQLQSASQPDENEDINSACDRTKLKLPPSFTSLKTIPIRAQPRLSFKVSFTCFENSDKFDRTLPFVDIVYATSFFTPEFDFFDG